MLVCSKRVAVVAAAYDRASNIVTLRTRVPVPNSAGQGYRLIVDGTSRLAVADAGGHRLDGDNDGLPGGNAVIEVPPAPFTASIRRAKARVR